MTELKYNCNIELGYIRRIARSDYVSARILWNIGIFLPSLHLLHESIEKYLKVLWARNKSFPNKDDLNRKLKKFGHDFNKIFSSLDKSDREALEQVMNKEGLVIHHLEALRYGITQPFIGYSTPLFRGAELFIKEIRKLLGEQIKKNLFEELDSGLFPHNFRVADKRRQAFKLILSLPRTGPTKKQKKEYRKKLREIVNKIRNAEKS